MGPAMIVTRAGCSQGPARPDCREGNMERMFFGNTRDRREGMNLSNAHPHPGPLPRGEGEPFGALSKYVGPACHHSFIRLRFRSCDEPGVSEFARDGRAILPLLGERAGVRASVQLILFLLCVWFGQPLFAAAEKFANADCLDCHTDPTNSRKVDGKTVPMALFPTNTFPKSVHGKLDCVDCHVGIKDLVHESKLPPPNCIGCHESQPAHEKSAKEYATSIHGVSHTLGASGAASCWDCHGSHEISHVKQADSPVFKLNLPQTCAKCHSNAGLTKEYQMKFPEAASQYMDSIHGRALLKMGLIVAPSCNDCHGKPTVASAVAACYDCHGHH